MKPSGSGHLLFECFLITVSISLLRFFSCFLFLPDSVLEDSTFLRICLLLDCPLIEIYLLASVYYDPLYFFAVSYKSHFYFYSFGPSLFLGDSEWFISFDLFTKISFIFNVLVSISFISLVILFISSTKFGFCLFCSF